MKIIDYLKKDVEGYDLELFVDYSDVPGSPESHEVYWIGTLSDRSVGIFSMTLSPTYENIDELLDWWETMKEILIPSIEVDYTAKTKDDVLQMKEETPKERRDRICMDRKVVTKIKDDAKERLSEMRKTMTNTEYGDNESTIHIHSLVLIESSKLGSGDGSEMWMCKCGFSRTIMK